MLGEIIKELMAKNNDDHITSGSMHWHGCKSVEVQRAQAVLLDSLTESKQFDKIKVSDKARDNKAQSSSKPGQHSNSHVQILWGSPPAKVVTSV